MDELLVKKAIKGDKDSFAALIEQYKAQAYRIAYCYLHNEEDSMDAVCDAVEKAYYHMRKIKQPRYFKTWFIRIVINECKQQLRAKQKFIDLADQLYAGDQEQFIPEDQLALDICLKQLPQLERVLIYMKYYMGYTIEEIAQSMEMSEGTVKTKIYRNLKKMKAQLEGGNI